MPLKYLKHSYVMQLEGCSRRVVLGNFVRITLLNIQHQTLQVKRLGVEYTYGVVGGLT